MKSNYLSYSNATAWFRRSLGSRLAARAISLLLFLVLAGSGAVIGCASTWTGSVGAVLGKGKIDGRVFVRDAPPDMAAAKAGVRIGDELVAVDGTPVVAMSPADMHRVLAGPVGSKVKLTVDRGGEKLELTVERGPLRE